LRRHTPLLKNFITFNDSVSTTVFEREPKASDGPFPSAP
jgi:hypothetical protein